MTESPAALTFLLSNDRKAAIIRAAHRERAAAFGGAIRSAAHLVGGAIRQLVSRKPATRLGASPAGFAR